MRKLLLVSLLKAVMWALLSTTTPPPVVIADGAKEPTVMERFMEWMRGTRPAVRTKRVRGTTWA